MNIVISTDSTADIPENYVDSLGIHVMPLTIIYNDREYRDGIDMKPREFYKILESCDRIPTHCQANEPEILEYFESIIDGNTTDLIHVSINSKGSGTYASELKVREKLLKKYPNLNVYIIDSGTYSMGYGIPVIEGAKMAKDGADAKTIVDYITDWVRHSSAMFVALDLKFVKQSGRISPAAALVGDMLGIKPVITFKDGEAVIVSKVRGEKNVINKLIEITKAERKPGSSYAIVHGSNDDAYQRLKEHCEGQFDIPPMTDYEVGCIIAINAGPNMVGIIHRT